MATGHRTTVTAMVQKHKWRRGAELGVEQGILARHLLTHFPKLSLIGVDNFSYTTSDRATVEGMVETFGGRFRLITMNTHDAAALVEDGSLDFVFIDALHTEDATMDDIEMWRSKVRAGGWLAGDAYNPQWYPQVVRAVHRCFPADRVTVLPGRVWGVWC